MQRAIMSSTIKLGSWTTVVITSQQGHSLIPSRSWWSITQVSAIHVNLTLNILNKKCMTVHFKGFFLRMKHCLLALYVVCWYLVWIKLSAGQFIFVHLHFLFCRPNDFSASTECIIFYQFCYSNCQSGAISLPVSLLLLNLVSHTPPHTHILSWIYRGCSQIDHFISKI